jgi:hypothetical protein
MAAAARVGYSKLVREPEDPMIGIARMGLNSDFLLQRATTRAAVSMIRSRGVSNYIMRQDER